MKVIAREGRTSCEGEWGLQTSLNVGVGGCPQRPRLPQNRSCSTLRRCGGSRPGSGWDRVGPPRSRPRAPPDLHIPAPFAAVPMPHMVVAFVLVWCLALFS